MLLVLAVALVFSSVFSFEYTVDLSKVDRKYDGTGALSAGASSRLLIDYSEPYRSQILDYLFKPSFGASLPILKVEIGGDTWSTCGTEPSHMHTPSDLNYYRGYEYWLMTEAKKRNPNIKLYALSWGFPAWIGSGALNENMANYTLQWIIGSEQIYNCTIDYIGIWNEDNWSTDYVKLLRKTLNNNNMQHIQIVVADGALGGVASIIKAMQTDTDFANSFDIIGVHYPTASEDTAAMAESGKILWSSEDSSTNDDMVGGGCWARILNWNYVYGNYTSTIMWSIISSWSEYLPYYGDGLMNAAWPWNSHYEVMSPLWMNAHTAQFTSVYGDYYIQNGYGSGVLHNSGGSYVTFYNPNTNDITIVIETMEYETSLCIRSNPSDFWNVSATQNITFKMQGNPNIPTSLYVWKSVLFGDNVKLFENEMSIQIDSNDNTFTLHDVLPNSVITLTTIATGNKGQYPVSPKKTVFVLPYSDDFQSYSNDVNTGKEPQAKYFSDQCGSFVVKKAMQKEESEYAMEQVVPFSPSLNNTGWHNSDAPQPLTIIGDYNLTDYNVSVSAFIVSNNQLSMVDDDDDDDLNGFGVNAAWNTSNIMIALRLGGALTQSGCHGQPREYPCVQAMGSSFFNYGYFLQINDDGYWKLMPGALNGILIDGQLNLDLRKVWFNVSLAMKGNVLSATFNGQVLFSDVTDKQNRFSSGWAGLSCGWQTCQFDDFAIYDL